jgi:hypothetical protein
MTVTTALMWVGALAALVIIARSLGWRSRRESYPFGVGVAVGIVLLGALTNVRAGLAPLVVVAVGAVGLWLAARYRARRR